MAVDVKKLKRPAGAGKGTPPAPTETNNNLVKPPTGKTVPLQVNIDPEVKRAYRVYAAERDIDMSNLFVTMWNYYHENHG
jgi:hypothetical protein